ncbi:hypothetical protein [Spiroplasma endosymbiont of Agriotes lineatus]|uniref:hypothetical protein n=1 Tax=Spiroplasma endosymbiont of Agriotes lineatus TaxID=3077930 RepID=UPI0030CF796A
MSITIFWCFKNHKINGIEEKIIPKKPIIIVKTKRYFLLQISLAISLGIVFKLNER